MNKLIYIMDPLCGWCYGNSTNTQKIYDKYKDIIDIEVLPAGMWEGTNTRIQSKQLVQFVKKHDPQVQQTTGTEFGKEYFEFIENDTIVLDSEVPSRAIITVKKLWPSQVVPFTIEVQKARYLHGKDLNEEATYLSICDDLKLDKTQFVTVFNSQSIKEETQRTFELAKQYANAYPTLIAEKEGEMFVVEQGYAPLGDIFKQIDNLFI